MAVDINEWIKDPTATRNKIASSLIESNQANRENIEADLARYGNVPLKELLTQDEYSKVRDHLNLPSYTAEQMKAFDNYDSNSRKYIEQAKLKTILVSSTSSENASGAITDSYPSVNPLLNYFLIPPSDHIAQVKFLEFTDDDTKKITLIDPSTLKGDEQKFYADYAAMAKRMGLSKPPELYYRSYDTGAEAEAVMMKDGTRAVILDKSIAEMPPAKRLLTIGH